MVPTGKKIRILIAANDVIHSWWVPAFGVKQDAIPGFIRDTWFNVEKPGIYRGQCSELCGMDHGFMPIVVVEAKTPEDYAKWMADQKAKLAAVAEDPNKVYTLAEMKAKGATVFTTPLRGLSSGVRHGYARRIPGIEWIKNRHGRQGCTYQYRDAWQTGYGDGGVCAAAI